MVFRPNPRLQPKLDQFAVHRLNHHTAQGLVNQVTENISTIFLQYSNYPYLLGKLDTPMWLVDALKILKQRGLRIVVMFHELPTLRYKQIRCPNFVQRRVSRGAEWTESPIHCVPNFSTIGELGKVPPLPERQRSLIVFGSSDRTRVYRHNTQTINQVCQLLKIDTLYDIGRPKDTGWDCG
ncbi:MAG: hypothetical protein AAGF93_04210 [Cyanobacteria bacterium P01_H01_bin.105]